MGQGEPRGKLYMCRPAELVDNLEMVTVRLSNLVVGTGPLERNEGGL